MSSVVLVLGALDRQTEGARKRARSAAATEEKFNYVVGRPPTGTRLAQGDNTLIVYTDGSREVQNGTMKDAEKFLDEANKKTGEKNFIYPLGKAVGS